MYRPQNSEISSWEEQKCGGQSFVGQDLCTIMSNLVDHSSFCLPKCVFNKIAFKWKTVSNKH